MTSSKPAKVNSCQTLRQPPFLGSQTPLAKIVNRAKADKRRPRTAIGAHKTAVCDSSPNPTWVNPTPLKPDFLLREAFLTKLAVACFSSEQLERWFSKRGHWTSSISITWELAENANSQAPPTDQVNRTFRG